MDHQGSDFFIQSVDRVSGIHRTLRQSLSRLIPLFGILFFLGAGFAAGPLEPGRYSSRLGKAELIRQGNMFQLNIQTAEGFYRVVGKEQNGGIQCMVVTPAGEKLSCAATAGDGRLDIRVQGQTYRFTRVTRQSGASAGSGSPGTGTGAPHAQREIGDPSWGFRFTPPKGWSARKIPAGFLLGHDSIKGFVLVSPHEMNSLDEIRAETRKGLVYEQTTRMTLAGPVQTLGQNMLGAEFKGSFQGTPARARIVGVLSPYGGGVLVQAAVEEAGYNSTCAALTEEIAKGVKFSRRVAPPIVKQLENHIRGKLLTYLSTYSSSGSSSGGYSTGGGFSTKTEIFLCTNGQFSYRGRDSMSFDTGGGFGGSHSRDNALGTWRVYAYQGRPVLELRDRNGAKREFRLSHRNRKTYLNGKRYFVTPNSLCP